MINVAICGLGRMGSYHLGIYERLMDEGFDVCVKAICDVEKDALDGLSTATMNQASQRHISTRTYAKYTSLDEMLQNEELDAVDVVTPTFLHSECAVKVLGSGRHCMCEKPMALDEAECRAMIDAAVKNGKVLMIGHCLRFWREYIWLHDRAVNGTYGELRSAYFTRGGFADHVNNPSWHDWIITAEQGGGALFDQHIHDSDFILWTFSMPESVTVRGRKYFPKSKNDIVSAQYACGDKILTAHDNIAYSALPFSYGYTADFERASAVFDGQKLTVYEKPQNSFVPDLSCYGDSDAYYNEIKYFLSCIKDGRQPTRCMPVESMDTVKLVRAEEHSADNGGVPFLIK